jgi:predicted glycoside hydrolase/deacetylase ChbG (UPF0249 family)
MTTTTVWSRSGVKPVPPTSQATAPILCADDFGLTAGVSLGIEELAAAGRISSTTAIVTLPTWRAEGLRLAALRKRVAIGLHVNLTVGRPLGPMSDLAPSGSFPPLNRLLLRCHSPRPPKPSEVASEVRRQIDRFTQVTGYEPDFIDGHQHVHVLPGIREGFLRAIASKFECRRPLVRDPSDTFVAIIARGYAVRKALTVAALARGFGAALRRIGFPVNEGFSGFSSFNPAIRYADELESYFLYARPLHVIMCHPGYPDDELARLDPLVGRRSEELRSLLSTPGLADRIWHVGPDRQHPGPVTANDRSPKLEQPISSASLREKVQQA